MAKVSIKATTQYNDFIGTAAADMIGQYGADKPDMAKCLEAVGYLKSSEETIAAIKIFLVDDINGLCSVTVIIEKHDHETSSSYRSVSFDTNIGKLLSLFKSFEVSIVKKNKTFHGDGEIDAVNKEIPDPL